MNLHRPVPRLVAAPLGALLLLAHAQAKEKVLLPSAVEMEPQVAKALLDTAHGINPEGAGTWRALVETFGKNAKARHGKYTVGEVLAIRDGQPPAKAVPHGMTRLQTGPVPPGAWSRQQVLDRYTADEKIARANGEKKIRTAQQMLKQLDERVQPYDKRLAEEWSWFTSEQVLNVETVPEVPKTKPGKPPEPSPEELRFNDLNNTYFEGVQHLSWEEKHFHAPRIRRSWRDVIFDEDQSQEGNGKAIGDLEGALISYVRDGEADSDTWNVHGAVILPFTWQTPNGPSGSILRFALAPSVTYDRVATNGDPKIEVDSLFYRVGGLFEYYNIHSAKDTYGGPPDPVTGKRPVHPTLGYGFQVRAAAVQVTDQDHRAGLSGWELDFEPRIHFGSTGLLGYEAIPWKKIPQRQDRKDDAYMKLQLRTYLHLEGGDVQDSAAGWGPVADSFFRLGPTVKFQLAFPALPGERTLSLTAVYSYYSAVSGPTPHHEYYRFTLDYDLFRNIELNHKVGISASYERGGLQFTQQDVDTLTVGLSVLF